MITITMLILAIPVYFLIGYSICYIFHKYELITYSSKQSKEWNEESREFGFILFGFFWPLIIAFTPFVFMLKYFQHLFDKISFKNEEKKSMKKFIKDCQEKQVKKEI